jgi:hypothetical protein
MGSGDYLELPLLQARNIRPSEALLGQWITTVWNDTSTQPIDKTFKQCCALNDIKWKDYDDVLWE